MTVFPILLIGLIAWMLPALVPRSVPFAVRIPGARAKEPVIAQQRRCYRYGIAAISLVVAAVVLATGNRPPLGGLGVAAELAGAFALFQVARRRIMAAKHREQWFAGLRQVVVADTSLRTDPEPYPWRWAVPSIALTAATVVIAILRYPHLPARLATHFDAAGHADRYAPVSLGSAFGPVAAQVLGTALLLGLAALVLRSKAQLDAEDPQTAGARHRRFVSSGARALLLAAACLSVTFLLTSLTAWKLIDLARPAPALVAIMPPLGVVVLVAVLVRVGQNGSRLRIRASPGTGSARRTTAVNRDDDRYWRLGLLYFNRDDPSLLVPHRFWLGWTLNLARPPRLGHHRGHDRYPRWRTPDRSAHPLTARPESGDHHERPTAVSAARVPLRALVAATALLIALSAGCSGGHPYKAATAAPRKASGDGGTTRELSFRSGPDTLPATLLSPDHWGREVPGALIISGSGPTDRDGNDRQFPHLDTNRNFARALSGDGVATLRYDKLGSGAAGLGAHPDPSDVDLDLYAREALDAYRTLARQPGIDPHRLIVVGHSEGGLFALWLADRLKGTPEAPQALVLAAPLGRRYLDVVARQLTDQYRRAQAAGQLSAKDAAARIADLKRIIATLRETGKPPAHLADPALAPALNPMNVAFLVRADRLDPADLARRLGPSLPVLVLRGTKDVQVDAGDIDHLMHGLAADRAAQRADIPDADHLFKVVTGTPNPPVDYANAGRPFAPQVAPRLASFLAPLK